MAGGHAQLDPDAVQDQEPAFAYHRAEAARRPVDLVSPQERMDAGAGGQAWAPVPKQSTLCDTLTAPFGKDATDTTAKAAPRPADQDALQERLGHNPLARDFDRQIAGIQVLAAMRNRWTTPGIAVTKVAGQVRPGNGQDRPSPDFRGKAVFRYRQ